MGLVDLLQIKLAMNLKKGDYEFNNLNTINILMGKNGTGKSTLLKIMLEAKNVAEDIKSEYMTPERGGFLRHDANIETTVSNNSNYIEKSRVVNQNGIFKQQTIFRFQQLELDILREVQSKKIAEDAAPKGTPKSVYTYFSDYISKINELLENIEIKTVIGEKAFKIFKKGTAEVLSPDQISSGESELISMAIECIFFQKSESDDKEKVLFLDEPDVHLHPDLQVKFMRFIHELATEVGSTFRVVIATHSTAFLGALEDTSDVNIAFIVPNQKIIGFQEITDIYKEFLPVFGAHPLSNVFNEAPVLLVEGEDDERIWQQAVRSSRGAIKLFPVVCGDKSRITIFEKEIKKVIESIYDNALAFSLRDRDDADESDMPDELPIVKLKLKCYSAENLLLTNEVLASVSNSWESFKTKMDEWILEKNGKVHPQLQEMIAFKSSGYDRKTFKLKNLRILLVGIMGSNKPWEVLVGQLISQIYWNDSTDYTEEGSINNYLGKKLIEEILQEALVP